jgi:outer membrane protein assembly factor BamD
MTPTRTLRRRAAALLMITPLMAGPLGGCSVLDSLNPWSGRSEDLTQKVDPGSEPVATLYNNGVDAMNGQNYETASDQFDLVQQYYPYSSWAVNAQLMEGYAEYLNGHYSDATGTLDRYIQLHPSSREIAYAYYLRALCYYEQISDIARDQKTTRDAMAALQEVVDRFPDSAYGRDARLKIDLCRDHLAGKEMAIGRWYENQHLYEAAIGRFQTVVDDYQTTNHVPEALHRLTEIYLKLGLVEQARHTAAVLGYNYPGNSWYEASYDQLVNDGQVKGVTTATNPDAGHRGFIGRTLGAIF